MLRAVELMKKKGNFSKEDLAKLGLVDDGPTDANTT